MGGRPEEVAMNVCSHSRSSLVGVTGANISPGKVHSQPADHPPNVPLHSIPDKLRFSQLNGCAHEEFPGSWSAIHHPLNKPGHFDAIPEAGWMIFTRIIKGIERDN